jgi:hypothetical protein
MPYRSAPQPDGGPQQAIDTRLPAFTCRTQGGGDVIVQAQCHQRLAFDRGLLHPRYVESPAVPVVLSATPRQSTAHRPRETPYPLLDEIAS